MILKNRLAPAGTRPIVCIDEAQVLHLLLGLGPDQTIIRSSILPLAGPTSGATMALPTGGGWLQLPEPGGHVKETAHTFHIHTQCYFTGSS